ncbi:Uncharacterised protein (plasmid) [Tsukamurella tyrosinosolvens]|nr:Uncharacterised protein [Tsukamurella tyrosinosolvens]
MLDRVDAGGQQAGQRVLTEDVRGDPGAGVVRHGDGLGEHVVGPQRREVTDGPVDPVPHELDPRVPFGGPPPDRVHELRRVLELLAEPARVPLDQRDVPAHPDEPREAGLSVQRRRVEVGTGFADHGDADGDVLQRQRAAAHEVGLAVLDDADVAMRVDVAGHREPRQLGDRTAGRIESHGTVGHPELAVAAGQDDAGEVQIAHPGNPTS